MLTRSSSGSAAAGERHRRARRTVSVLAVVFALVAAACGGDDDASDTTSQASTSAGSTAPDSAPTAAGEVSVGGDAVVLLPADQASMDPVRLTGSGLADSQRAFAVYGALVGMDAVSGEVEPILAQSLEPDETFTTWTLMLREGLVFTDGTPFDADAVRINWERILDPDSGSPALGFASSISSMKVVDSTTFRVTLQEPNAHFDHGVSRQALNYIASPDAIATGHDLDNDPVGAGPFEMVQWVRDDRMELERNPDWFDSPRPYLDTLTIRVIPDEEQRADTFLTGDADGMYSTLAGTPARVAEESGGETLVTHQALGQVLAFNTSRPPFDDPRVRRAVALGVDRFVMGEAAEGEAVDVAQYFAANDSPWSNEAAPVPAHDPDEAQTLLDAYAQDTGSPARFAITATPSLRNRSVSDYIQAAMGQLDNVEVEVNTVDLPTMVESVMQGDYDVTIWGFPFIDPDPGLYNAARSGLPTNVARYSNPEVDAALDAARQTDDQAARTELYFEVQAILAEDLPFLPVTNTTNAFTISADMGGLAAYEDGLVRLDLLGRVR